MTVGSGGLLLTPGTPGVWWKQLTLATGQVSTEWIQLSNVRTANVGQPDIEDMTVGCRFKLSVPWSGGFSMNCTAGRHRCIACSLLQIALDAVGNPWGCRCGGGSGGVG